MGSYALCPNTNISILFHLEGVVEGEAGVEAWEPVAAEKGLHIQIAERRILHSSSAYSPQEHE